VQSRGWADPQNHKSLTKGGNYNSTLAGEPLTPGKFYDLTFDLQPADRVIPPGKQLALMIMSSDRDFTLWPLPGTRLTVELSRTKIELPVVGGVNALQKAIK
jgi:X-Pro dipeptidyl-peptidase